jgi:hypothetical protein
MPFTAQMTVVSEELRTLAVNGIRWLGASVAVGGETLMETLLVSVTVAEADAVTPLDGLADASIVTGFTDGILKGAV